MYDVVKPKRIRMYRALSSEKYPYEICKVGKDILIINHKNKTYSRASKTGIKNMSRAMLQNQKTAVIRAVGVSRAQIGQIARYMHEGTESQVYIQEIAPVSIGDKKYLAHKIIMTRSICNAQKT